MTSKIMIFGGIFSDFCYARVGEGVIFDHFLSQKSGFWDFFKVVQELFKTYFERLSNDL